MAPGWFSTAVITTCTGNPKLYNHVGYDGLPPCDSSVIHQMRTAVRSPVIEKQSITSVIACGTAVAPVIWLSVAPEECTTWYSSRFFSLLGSPQLGHLLLHDNKGLSGTISKGLSPTIETLLLHNNAFTVPDPSPGPSPGPSPDPNSNPSLIGGPTSRSLISHEANSPDSLWQRLQRKLVPPCWRDEPHLRAEQQTLL